MNAVLAAWIEHENACHRWRGVPLSEFLSDGDHRLARPFGRPVAMPPHRWRVSRDVMQALTDASPPPDPMPHPKTSDGATTLLFGWPIDVDREAPEGTLILALAEGVATPVAVNGESDPT